jgi:hypothetical protein
MPNASTAFRLGRDDECSHATRPEHHVNCSISEPMYPRRHYSKHTATRLVMVCISLQCLPPCPTSRPWNAFAQPKSYLYPLVVKVITHKDYWPLLSGNLTATWLGHAVCRSRPLLPGLFFSTLVVEFVPHHLDTYLSFFCFTGISSLSSRALLLAQLTDKQFRALFSLTTRIYPSLDSRFPYPKPTS